MSSTKLWDKGFEPDRMIEEYTVGQDRELDMRLARYDVEGSLAHIAMLENCGRSPPKSRPDASRSNPARKTCTPRWS